MDSPGRPEFSMVAMAGFGHPGGFSIPAPAPRTPPAPRLSERAREAMRLRHFSPRTEEAYLGWMRRYHEFHGRRDPAGLGPEHLSWTASRARWRGCSTAAG